MSTFFITRHPGAREWAAQEGITVDFLFDHLDPEIIRSGDVVIGSLPVNLAAEVCSRGGHYWHLSLNIPAMRRGFELSAEEMRAFNARLEEYFVCQVHNWN